MTPASTTSQSEPGKAGGLTWGIVTATYNRQQVLPRAVRCAVRQDPPPMEIVIIDASRDWATTKDMVAKVITEEGSSARLVYEPAKTPSSTAQRNQGISSASADVLFVIDDDSLMHPGCARHVLDVFNHPDASTVLGACTSLSPREPDKMTKRESAVEETAAEAGAGEDEQPQGRGKVNKNRQTGLGGRITKWFIGEYLPHYQNPRPQWHVPQSLRDAFGCFTRRQVHGARMIFRRSAVLNERFDEALTRYAYLEDTDLGYRLGKAGIIVMIPKAKICHLGEYGGRLPTIRASIISVTNAAFLTRKNAEDVAGNMRRLRIDALKRSLFVLVKDLSRGQWRIPQFRGAWIGLMQTRWIASTPIQQLDDRYKQFQEKLLAEF